VIFLDYETRSTVDLKKAGAHRYAEDPTTDIWCACYALDDGPVKTWVPGDPCPDEIFDAVLAGDTISGWNVAFEKAIWRAISGPRYDWPVPLPEQFDDTAAAAAAMGLPRNLGDATKAMGSVHEKDDAGHRLMMQMARPRRGGEGLRWWDDDERKGRLFDYCADDVHAEREMRRLLVPLPPEERETWLFDQRMNDRGVALDLPLIHALLRIVDQEKKRLDDLMADVTNGAVTACTQVARLSAWLREQGVPAESLAKAAIEDLLLDVWMPERAREAILLRKEAAKSSTAKLQAMLNCVCADGRARGLHLYHGAGTGRWSGRLIQPQNMPRGTGTVDDPEAAAEDFLHGDAGWIRLLYGNPMSAVSDMLRACLVGKRLLAADFSAIEGRVTAWLAGEAWKIEAFEAADAGTGPGIYELTAAGILSKDITAVTKAERQAYGKVPELALGFQGGVSAFDSMARVYAVDMADAYEPLMRTTDDEVWTRAEKRYAECLERLDTGTDTMTREAWIASEVTKVLWRKKHPATVALWKGLEEAAFDAVLAPGNVISFRGIGFVVKRGFLWCKLPSSRCLAYGSPKIQDRKQPWGAVKAVVTALGVDSTTKRWLRFALYGGLITENCVQAIARDVMRDGMLAVEAAGYPVVLTVHDEAVAEVDEGFGGVEDFERLLATTAPWAAGLPVVASGFEAKRYRK
jgi:DNA polymerase